MRHATAILAFAVTVFIVGCQNSDDILNSSHQQTVTAQPLSKSQTCRRAEIRGHVRVPGQFNSILEVAGAVEYSITLLPRDPIPPNPQYSLELGMIVKAELREIEGGAVWQTAGTSLDELGYNDGDELSVIKRYWVANLNGGMWLNITFIVTEDEVEARVMWLQLPKYVRDGEGN